MRGLVRRSMRIRRLGAGRPLQPMLAALAFTVLAGCSDSVFEAAAGDLYVLVDVNGRTLPVTVGNSATIDRTLYADTILFLATDRYERFRWFGVRQIGSDQVHLERESSTGVVRRGDGSVTLVDGICANPDALVLCIPPDTATTIDTGQLILRGPVPPAGIKRFEAR